MAKATQVSTCGSASDSELPRSNRWERTLALQSRRFAIMVAIATALNACSSRNMLALFDRDANTRGAVPLFEDSLWEQEDDFEEVDLVLLLDPLSRSSNKQLYEDKTATNSTEFKLLPEQQQLEIAFTQFYLNYLPRATDGGTQGADRTRPPIVIDDEGARQRRLILDRNRIQDRLLEVSNQRCSSFQQLLKQWEGDVDFLAGGAAIVAGGAGALVSGGASQILSGTAAILTGVRAEYDQAYFRRLGTETLTKGMNARRERILSEIQISRGQPTAVAALSDVDQAEASLRAAERELAEAVLAQARANAVMRAANSAKMAATNAKNAATAAGDVAAVARHTKEEQDQVAIATRQGKIAMAASKKAKALQACPAAGGATDCGIIENLIGVRDQALDMRAEGYRLTANNTVAAEAPVTPVPVSGYTVERAIADIIRYHGACSVIAGLEEASDSITKVQSPGIDVFKDSLQKFGFKVQVNSTDSNNDGAEQAE